MITSTNNRLLAITFSYTMGFDAIVLSLTAWKLGIKSLHTRDRSRIVRLIFDDGLIYFIVA